MAESLNRKQLYDLVWKKPMVDAAKDYGLSDRGLAKLCERHGIPVPPRGWWAKKNAGQKVKKVPLLEPDPETPDTVILFEKAVPIRSTAPEPENALPESVREAMARESDPKYFIPVPETLKKPHSIVAGWIAEEEQRSDSYRRWGGGYRPEPPTPLERRRRRIISALLRACEERGFKAEKDNDRYGRTLWIVHQRDRIAFTVEEKILHIKRRLTEEEKVKDRKENPHWSPRQWSQTREPSGRLLLKLSGTGHWWQDRDRFEETVEQALDTMLNRVMARIIALLWEVKVKRLQQEQESHRRWEVQKQREREEAMRRREEERQSALEHKAADWKKAQEIRDYIAALERAGTGDPDRLVRFAVWALAHAHSLDPIASGDPFVALEEEPGERREADEEEEADFA